VKSVTQEYEKLAKEIFPDLKIAMLHGKMRPKEKEEIMTKFKDKKTDVLVSTSVIEVGIDISNATVMMIEGSERFGLAQLHQFRGRVGRGEHQSYCFLFTDSPVKTTQARLKALLKCENGFELAEKDLKIRGPGELYGVRQSGLPDLAMANLGNLPLVEQTRKEANNLLDKDSELKNYPLLQEKLKEFHRTIHFE
jgi:ATP-dependent DNA helicase RecG